MAWAPTGAVLKGPKGDKGDIGATGATGQRGSKWWNGTGAPGTITGSLPGDYYMDDATGEVYLLS